VIDDVIREEHQGRVARLVAADDEAVDFPRVGAQDRGALVAEAQDGSAGETDPAEAAAVLPIDDLHVVLGAGVEAAHEDGVEAGRDADLHARVGARGEGVASPITAQQVALLGRGEDVVPRVEGERAEEESRRDVLVGVVGRAQDEERGALRDVDDVGRRLDDPGRLPELLFGHGLLGVRDRHEGRHEVVRVVDHHAAGDGGHAPFLLVRVHRVVEGVRAGHGEVQLGRRGRGAAVRDVWVRKVSRLYLRWKSD